MAAATKRKQASPAAASDRLPEWDLSALYKGMQDPAIARDAKRLEKDAADFAKQYQGQLKTLAPAQLLEAVAAFERIEQELGKLGSYAQLLYAGNMQDSAIAQFYQNISDTLTNISSKLIFFGLEINRLDDAFLAKSFAASKKLARYRPWFDHVRNYKPYQLSDELEQYIHESSVVEDAWSRLFDESIARLSFKVGKKKLGSAEVFDLLSHKSPKKRRKAAEAIARAFKKNAPLFALITNTLAKGKEVEDKKRGFKKPISSRNVDNQVEDEVVAALIATVKKNYGNLSHRYYAWKAAQFGRSALNYWDRNAPLPAESDRRFDWNGAVSTVLSAYKAFSPEMARLGMRFFNERWIDAPVRPGKDPGAFAHPTVPSAHPFILMNYQGKTRDVMTLAHELGHGVHQLLSAAQGALMADTPLTLAETASVFGEMLTFQELLAREKDETRRKLLIAGKVEDMLNTVVRQVAFCEFERLVHEERRKGELTPERIGELWMKVQAESLGPAIKLTPDYSVYWMYIPHFIHTPFYVYAYAFGDCLVNSLYGVYRKEAKAGRGKQFAAKYLDMLKAGGTKRHKELLKPFGLDASKPDFWQAGLDVIGGYIDQLVK
ncbi:MAG: M3 family oligoendopeptidase [Alphaproteobacteria bacterium]